MIVVAVCGALLLAGLSAGVVWGRRPFVAPAPEPEPTALGVIRRYAWYYAVGVLAGLAAGLTVMGAGGRLAMRLLAVTSGDDAQGRITEAGAVVGEITPAGTVDLIVFATLGGALASLIYLLVRRLLPSGRFGGVVFGLGLLLAVGFTIDPLREDNPDFDIVGPGWLSIVVFTALAGAYGLALVGFTARLSEWLPLVSSRPRVLIRYAVPGVIALVGLAITAMLVVVGAALVVASRSPRLVRAVRSSRAVTVGRVLAVGVVVVALPNALPGVVDIATRAG